MSKMKVINSSKTQMNRGDSFSTPVPDADFPGSVTLMMSDGSILPTTIKSGDLIHERSVNPQYLVAMIAEKKLVKVGTLTGADGERMEIEFRPELRKLFDPCVVELATTRKAWPLLKSLSEKD